MLKLRYFVLSLLLACLGSACKKDKKEPEPLGKNCLLNSYAQGNEVTYNENGSVKSIGADQFYYEAGKITRLALNGVDTTGIVIYLLSKNSQPETVIIGHLTATGVVDFDTVYTTFIDSGLIQSQYVQANGWVNHYYYQYDNGNLGRVYDEFGDYELNFAYTDVKDNRAGFFESIFFYTAPEMMSVDPALPLPFRLGRANALLPDYMRVRTQYDNRSDYKVEISHGFDANGNVLWEQFDNYRYHYGYRCWN